MKQACGSIRDSLGAYADNELGPARADEVRCHIEACADCRSELAQIRELHRLAKSVEHPRLAEDYWDWQRTKVWRGIRGRRRAPTPWHRPSFVWPKLAAAAAGFAVVLVVVLAGWRTFLPKPGPAGVAVVERKTAAEAPAATAPGARPLAASEEVEPVADAARAKTGARADGLGKASAAAERDAEKTDAGYAGKVAGAIGTASVSKPAPAPRGGTVSEMEAAVQHDEGPAAAPAAEEPQVLVSSKKESRIVSGPVLLESPPMPDADVLDTGTVLLSVQTDSSGRVLSAAVRRSSGSSQLDSLAVRQMRKSRFQAAVKKNRSVASSFEYPFRFQKKQAKPPEEQKPQEEQKQRDQEDESNKQEDETHDKPLKEKTKK